MCQICFLQLIECVTRSCKEIFLLGKSCFPRGFAASVG